MNGTRSRCSRPATARALLPAATLLLALFGAGCGDDKGEDRNERATSLLFITIDTLRADRLGCTGRSEAVTPVLDNLAREGALSDQMIVSAPITLPSHATFMTGLLPHELGIRDNRPFAVPEKTDTVAERLAATNYQTAAVVSGEPLEDGCGLEQGFERYCFRYGPRQAKVLLRESPADRTVDTAIDLAGRFDRSKPFFLWVHFFDPHHPYIAPVETPGGDAYDGEVAFVDREIGRLLARLEKSGLMEKTLVVVASDHGEGLGDHGESTHAYFLFDSTIRVPLIVKGPGIEPGRRLAGQIRAQDLPDALLRLLGVDTLHAAPGPLDLAARLKEGEASPFCRPAFTESLFCNSHFHWAQLSSLRTDDFKVIRGARTEIFEIVKDIDETAPFTAAKSDEPGLDLARRLSERVNTARAPDHAPTRRLVGSLPGYLGSTASLGGPFLKGEKNAALPHPSDNVDILTRFLEAVSLNQAGLFNQSRVILEELAQKDEDNPSLLFWLGRTLRSLGEKENDPALIDKAHGCFSGALERDRNFIDAFHMSVWCLLRLGRFEEARRELDSSLALEPDNAKSVELYGYLLTTPASNGIKNLVFDLDAGLLCFQKSIELNQNNPGLLQNLVAIYNSMHRPKIEAKYRAMLEKVLRGPELGEADKGR